MGRYFDTMLQNYARPGSEVFPSASAVEDVSEPMDNAADILATEAPAVSFTPAPEPSFGEQESQPSAPPALQQSAQAPEPIDSSGLVKAEPSTTEQILRTEVVHDQGTPPARLLPDTPNLEQPTTISQTDLHITEHHDHQTTHEHHDHHAEHVTEQLIETTVKTSEPTPPPPQLDVPDVKGQVDAIEEQLGKALLQMREGTFDPTSFLVPSEGFEPQQDAPYMPPEAEIITEVTHKIVREVHHHHHETRIEPATVAPMPIRTAAAASQIGPIRFQSVWDRERSH